MCENKLISLSFYSYIYIYIWERHRHWKSHKEKQRQRQRRCVCAPVYMCIFVCAFMLFHMWTPAVNINMSSEILSHLSFGISSLIEASYAKLPNQRGPSILLSLLPEVAGMAYHVWILCEYWKSNFTCCTASTVPNEPSPQAQPSLLCLEALSLSILQIV